MDTPILWQFLISHYAEKARWALDYKGVPHIRRSLLPGPHMARLQKMTGQNQVPVLEINGEAICDSTRIIERLESDYPAPPLYPSDPAEREAALELEHYFDEELGPYIRQWAYFHLLPNADAVTTMFAGPEDSHARAFLQKIFPAVREGMCQVMNINAQTAEEARLRTVASMDRIAREVRPSGYLVGDRFTVADLTAAALLWPSALPKEFPYAQPTPPPAEFAAANAPLLEHPAIKWTLGIYARHRGKSAAVAEETVI